VEDFIMSDDSSIVEEPCNAAQEATQAKIYKPVGHHLKKRLNGYMSRGTSKLEATQLILAFDQLGDDEDR
jgi:hypothetical protein